MPRPANVRNTMAAPADDDHVEASDSFAMRATPRYSSAAPTTMTAPTMRTAVIKPSTSMREPRKVVAANARKPSASTIDAMLTKRPIVAVVSPGRVGSTWRKSSIAAISSGVIEDMSLEPIAAISSGVIEDMSSPAAAVAASSTVKEKLPSIGWLSPARTLQPTPTTPPFSAGSNASTKTLPSAVVTEVGSRTCPVGSSTTNPSPASSETPVNRRVISSTGSATTAPFDGSDPAKLVWADTAVAPITTPNVATPTPTSVATKPRRSACGRAFGFPGADMAAKPTTRCSG